MKKFFALLVLPILGLIITACASAPAPEVVTAHTEYATTLSCEHTGSVVYYTQNPAKCSLEDGALSCTTLGGPALIKQMGSGGFRVQADSPLLASSSAQCYIMPAAHEPHDWGSDEFNIDDINRFNELVGK